MLCSCMPLLGMFMQLVVVGLQLEVSKCTDSGWIFFYFLLAVEGSYIICICSPPPSTHAQQDIVLFV